VAHRVFDRYATFAAGAANGTVISLDVDLPPPGEEAPDGNYLVSAISDAALDAPVTVQCYNRIPIETPGRGLRYEMVPVGPALGVTAQGTNSQVVQGWLVGRSPAQVQITLGAAASAAGGRVWVVVYALGRR
jgi:hypothetical protein